MCYKPNTRIEHVFINSDVICTYFYIPSYIIYTCVYFYSDMLLQQTVFQVDEQPGIPQLTQAA